MYTYMKHRTVLTWVLKVPCIKITVQFHPKKYGYHLAKNVPSHRCNDSHYYAGMYVQGEDGPCMEALEGQEVEKRGKTYPLDPYLSVLTSTACP